MSDNSNRWISWSITQKMVVSQIGLIALLAVCLGSVAFYLMEERESSILQDSLQFRAEHMASHLDHLLNKYQDELFRVAKGDAVTTYLEQYKETRLLAWFANFKQTFAMLSFVTPQGMEEVRMSRGNGDGDMRDFCSNDLFTRARSRPNQIVFSAIKECQLQQQPVIAMGLFSQDYFG